VRIRRFGRCEGNLPVTGAANKQSHPRHLGLAGLRSLLLVSPTALRGSRQANVSRNPPGRFWYDFGKIATEAVADFDHWGQVRVDEDSLRAGCNAVGEHGIRVAAKSSLPTAPLWFSRRRTNIGTLEEG
jgi:hypothetical protein